MDKPTPLDLDHYCWREEIITDDGEVRYVTPHSDPHQYEYDLDAMFAGPNAIQDAMTYLDDMDIDEEERQHFVLIHYIGTILNPFGSARERMQMSRDTNEHP